jgi:hypothetical protein
MSASASTGKEAYNIVSDTVVGANVRLKDNLFQGLAILVFAILGGVLGLIFVEEPLAGLMLGGIGGLIVGLFLSGIALMIFRGVRHLQGKHD